MSSFRPCPEAFENVRIYPGKSLLGNDMTVVVGPPLNFRIQDADQIFRLDRLLRVNDFSDIPEKGFGSFLTWFYKKFLLE